MSSSRNGQSGFWRRHPIGQAIALSLASLFGVIFTFFYWSQLRAAAHQVRLQSFYDTANLNLNGPPGQIVRQEPLGVTLTAGRAERILYRTQRADGSAAFSSGMIFLPKQPASGPRPIVAWAHGTLGLGDACAPSRTINPVASLEWVNTMLQKGWIVTATDYAGFGTAGTQGYLVGGDEARDVLNSVRAARQLAGADASNQFVIWGHSQGGNSALFAAAAATSYAPELHLVGTVTSAPAAELTTLFNEQVDSAINWVIGPLIMVAWPASNPSLQPDNVLTTVARRSYRQIANQCIVGSTLQGLIRTALKQKFFSTNLTQVPEWRSMAQQQSAPVLSSSQPLLVVESKSDQVVLPNTTALYIQTACRAGSNLSSYWLDGVSHQNIPAKSAGKVIDWLGARLSGQPQTSNCNQPLPVTPAQSAW